MSELKPCPFCGRKPRLSHGDISKISNSSRLVSIVGDYVVSWSIECRNCGIPKIERRTNYILTNEGRLEVTDGKDGRERVIDDWNRRVGDDLMERMVDDGK